ncbi:spore coat protein [Paenibacillus hexagrammi]|uniref:Spore coat protein n=1 Tax=Paenibacillus hexagrammi TaxID=2908839 RepID=A0ABY3SJ33_9BACL|nr:spore coat protein [Paenibacillus sp. YPD9-1]UJF33151.1 spore coat protein [Paenibacillus sp. YPD9-1]
MFQQNPYQQQSFGTQQNQQSQGNQVYLEDQDLANFVLSELKRAAREYTTAALESANPQIRQTFQSLLQKTLNDQATIFQEIQKLGGYDVQPANQQQLQQELQKHSQCATRLQSFVQQNMGQMNTTQQQNQFMAGQQQQYAQYSQQPSQYTNTMAAQQQAFQPLQTINANAYPNAISSQSYPQSAASQHTSYNTLHNKAQQEHDITSSQGMTSSDYGMGGLSQSAGSSQTGRTGYYTGSGSISEAGANPSSVQGQSSGIAARHQTTSGSTSDSSYISKHHEGSKYSF